MTLVSTELDAFAPAHAMLSALRGRHLSSREIVQMHLDRIGRDNGAPNAIVVPANEPLAAADAADRLRTEGEQGGVLGLPVTLKESTHVLGTTVGVPQFKEFVAADYGAVPQGVLGAGAVLGETNVPPMLADWQSTNPIYGRTVNPSNAAVTPGGSTGGAAAIAAGLCPVEFGSDIGGSAANRLSRIREPPSDAPQLHNRSGLG